MIVDLTGPEENEPKPIYNESDISSILASEWSFRSAEFGLPSEHINQELCSELSELIDNGYTVDFGTSPGNQRLSLLKALQIIRSHPKPIRRVEDTKGMKGIGPFVREKIGIALENMKARAKGEEVEYTLETRRNQIDNIGEFRTKLLAVPRNPTWSQLKLPPNLQRSQIKIQWLQSGIEYLSPLKIIGTSPGTSPTTAPGLTAMVNGSNGNVYCVSFTFTSDKMTVVKASCECPCRKKINTYWCKHLWAVAIYHCSESELVRLGAIATAEYIESPDHDISPSKSQSKVISLEDEVVKTLEFESPVKPTIRRSSEYPLKESPNKIIKLTKSQNDIAMKSPIRDIIPSVKSPSAEIITNMMSPSKESTTSVGLNMLSSEIIMHLYNKKAYNSVSAICKIQLKQELNLTSFNKICNGLLSKGYITENEDHKLHLSTKGVAFANQNLRMNPPIVEKAPERPKYFPNVLETVLPIPAQIHWPPRFCMGPFKNFPSTHECSIEEYTQLWNYLMNPTLNKLPTNYYGFQFGYSRMTQSEEESLHIVYVESAEKIRVLVPSNQVNRVIAWMTTWSKSTGEGLYKELAAFTVGITLNAVKKYFTLTSIPPKGIKVKSMAEIKLLIDFREKFDSLDTLRTMMSTLSISTEIRSMPEGDFGWAIETEDGKFQVECLVERKKLMDLLSTLDDTRAYDQPDRLTNKDGKWDIFYLIEGDKQQNSRYQEQVNQERVDSFFASLKEKNIQIHETLSELGTFEWLVDQSFRIFEKLNNVDLCISNANVIEINDT